MRSCLLASLLVAALASGCNDGRVTVSPSSVPVEDNFFATWEIQSTRVGPVGCTDVGATRVDVDAVSTTSGERRSFTFACDTYQGTSGEVGMGSFDVLLDLIDAGGAVLAQTAVGTKDLRSAGTIDLGHRVFVVP